MSGSLTWFVANHRDFWNRATPYTSKVIAEVNALQKQHKLLVPLAKENRPYAGEIGLAVDYTIGAFYDREALVQISARQVLTFRETKPFWRFALQFLLFRCIDEIDDPSLVRSNSKGRCMGGILLLGARGENAFRTGDASVLPDTSGIGALDPKKATFKQIETWVLKRIPSTEINEWLEITQRLATLTQLSDGDRSGLYNPVFGQCGIISGSDGDLIVNDTLYEIKCLSGDYGFKGDHLRQVLGYCALNVLNGLNLPINRVGLVNPRRGFAWSEDLGDVAKAVGAGSFRAFVEKFRKATAV